MDLPQVLHSQSLYAGLNPEAIARLGQGSETLSVEAGTVLTGQYHPADKLYLLLTGSVQFFIRLEGAQEDLLVGSSDKTGTPLGWSGLLPGQRYNTTIRCETPCTLLAWEISMLSRALQTDNTLQERFLNHMAGAASDLLVRTRGYLTGTADHPLLSEPTGESITAQVKTAQEVFQQSAFFENMPGRYVAQLAEAATLHRYHSGSTLFLEGDDSDGLYVLAQGTVALHFFPPGQHAPQYCCQLSVPGQIASWSALTADSGHPYTVTARDEVMLFRVHKTDLEQLCRDEPGLRSALLQRSLWLLAQHLRTVRVQQVSAGGREIVLYRVTGG